MRALGEDNVSLQYVFIRNYSYGSWAIEVDGCDEASPFFRANLGTRTRLMAPMLFAYLGAL